MLDRVRIVRTHPELAGAGFLAGEAPDGLTTVNGSPQVCEIRVSERATSRMVARVWSASDGTYRIDGMNPAIEFDVRAMDPNRQWKDRIEPAVKPEPY